MSRSTTAPLGRLAHAFESPRGSDWFSLVLVGGIALAAAVYAGSWLGGSPNLRSTVAAVVGISVAAAVWYSPRAAILAIMLWLPMLGLVRRLLLLDPLGPWVRTDPMLLVAPAVTAVLLLRLLPEWTRGMRESALLRWCGVLLVVELAASLNPMQGSAEIMASGVLFFVVPTSWVLVGYAVGSERMLRAVLTLICVVGVGTGLYGISQAWWGYGRAERLWVDVAGYAALNVRGSLRPISTFVSGSEFAGYAAIASVLFAAILMRARGLATVAALIGLSVAIAALFVQASRTLLVMLPLCVTAMAAVGLASRPARMVTFGAVAGLVIAFVAGGERLLDILSGTPLQFAAEHQVKGLLNPLDPTQSTAQGHVTMVVDAIRVGVTTLPLGAGLGAMSLGGAKFGAAAGSELDVTDFLLGAGIPGAFVYLVVLAVSLLALSRAARASSGWVQLAAFGCALVALGAWLRGNQYAVAPLVWFVIGASARHSAQLSPPERIDVPPADRPTRAGPP